MSTGPLAAKGVVSRTVGGETVLVPVRAPVTRFNNLFHLNRVASFLWKHLDGARDRDALCALVRAEFSVPAERDVGADVDQFLGALTERGLVDGAP